MKEIKLTRGYIAIIDDCDFENIKMHKWYFHDSGPNRKYHYAITCIDKKHIKMHRLIMSVNDPLIFVDHKDHNGLNNTRSNLRICSRSQNTINRKKALKYSSKYNGVYKLVSKKGNSKTVLWCAQINFNGQRIYLGTFPFTEVGEIQAAKIRDQMAVKYFGEFATLNFTT